MRFLAAFLGVLAAVLLVFAFSIGFYFKYALIEKFDRQLVAFARAALISIDIEEGQFDFRGGLTVPTPSLPVDTEVQWFDPEGRLLRQVGTLTTISAVLHRGGFGSDGEKRIWTEPVSDARTGKQVGYLQVTRSLESVESTLQQLWLGLLAGIPVALALSAVGGWWFTGLVIRPIADNFRRLEQFTADASHELRNPLMAIQSNCAVALKYADGQRPGDRQKFLLIEDATRQLHDFTQDLLMLARAGEDTAPRQAVNFAQLSAEVVAGYAHQADQRSLTLDYKGPPSADGSEWLVAGKPAQLRCLLSNLLDNALKFTPAGGQVTVTLERQKKMVVLTVADTGIGITATELPHIFDRFWQADRARHHQGGSGLGLAIARSIAHDHRGSLEVASEPGRGSRFKVVLPGAQ